MINKNPSASASSCSTLYEMLWIVRKHKQKRLNAKVDTELLYIHVQPTTHPHSIASTAQHMNVFIQFCHITQATSYTSSLTMAKLRTCSLDVLKEDLKSKGLSSQNGYENSIERRKYSYLIGDIKRQLWRWQTSGHARTLETKLCVIRDLLKCQRNVRRSYAA